MTNLKNPLLIYTSLCYWYLYIALVNFSILFSISNQVNMKETWKAHFNYTLRKRQVSYFSITWVLLIFVNILKKNEKWKTTLCYYFCFFVSFYICLFLFLVLFCEEKKLKDSVVVVTFIHCPCVWIKAHIFFLNFISGYTQRSSFTLFMKRAQPWRKGGEGEFGKH